ncbi:MAG: guanine deaminase [Gammaproteobacteria bacterium]|nr:guanine deaminase [Gammaproteobacteria bacterium]NIR88833.1 guanine deaminase [Gammaproteobacteria bacterium]NIU06437.1 guanine deaminase [Gammaproteobacteria bacterium]NIV53329.1 guanine deaminase [Gammaproteobacteria bacterium]NIV74048.1 guanine deaminase [Gammaproteobacteria bacterium]
MSETPHRPDREQPPVLAIRGDVLHCLRDPGEPPARAALEHLPDGLLVVRDGRIDAVGAARSLLPKLGAEVAVHDHSGRLIVPGFVDAHVHYPQTDIIASDASRLLEWLRTYTFPTEQRFDEPDHAREVAEFFLDELLRNGTTTALVMATVHEASVDAIFTAAETRGMRLVAGKMMMDRNCPPELCDRDGAGYAASKALIERWHGRGRLLYAVTPRFAPTSSEAQLEHAGRLLAEHPDVYFHTHLAENREEVAWVAELFPWSRSYLDVYDRFGLVGQRAVFAHCIHVDDDDRSRMAATGATAAFCPTSNLFLGSGLYDLAAARRAGITVGVGTDVGGGTSFSLLRTLDEGYKVAQLQGGRLSAEQAFYLATLGGARALDLDQHIGSFAPGKEADFTVLDPRATPLLARRTAGARDIGETLFALLLLGDDRCVAATYVMGAAAYARTPA